MANFQAVYYRDSKGCEPVKEFIDQLGDEARETLLHHLGLLNQLSDKNPHLPFPHSSQVEGEIRELRAHYGRVLYRVLHSRPRRLVVLLHIIEKRTQKIPRKDIAVAVERWSDFKNRMDKKPRKGPRPAGKDAP